MTSMSKGHQKVTPELAKDFGLSATEYDEICKLVGRPLQITELAIYSAMWSEHCSYKSSKRWLSKLPTQGPQVVHGPGENAGVIDIGDDDLIVFKMESHNHPSFIEPVQGAATGVGGIMRDIFTMGARPIANLNALRFGDPSHPRTRALVAGVVQGIGSYGNCVGIPTVGGEINFHPAYNGNILVNAMTVGLTHSKRLFTSAATGVGNPVVYVGAKTGRDGIHGATMASASFDDSSADNRPTVQVGDPFQEKLLLEACLELMDCDAIVAIQDMGAAGLTSSAVEMASKGGVGMDLDLSLVPTRETSMEAWEIMLSESQERMLIVLRPGFEKQAETIFHKWELAFASIGTLTDTGRLVIRMGDEIECDLDVEPLVESAPNLDRPWTARPKAKTIDPTKFELPALSGPEGPAFANLLTLMSSPDLASRRWVWEQYDSRVMGDTVQPPGGSAAVVRVHGTDKAVAITTDVTPRYCRADPETGGMQAVAEAWRNLTATGALPLAITDNLNFGNPEKPEIMGEIVGCIEGIRAACLALDMPVVSGNVSLYNETLDESILPTPAIGAVGLLKDIRKTVSMYWQQSGLALMRIGDQGSGWLGQSLYAREIYQCEDGAPPPVNLAAERKTGDYVRHLIEEELVLACTDISDGGLLVAAAEMALASNSGLTFEGLKCTDPGELFGEDQGRYLIATAEPELVKQQAGDIATDIIAWTGGNVLCFSGGDSLSLTVLRQAWEGWFSSYMEPDMASNI